MECSPVNSTNFRTFISNVRKLYIKLRNSEAKLANMFLRWATHFFSVVISIWASVPLRTEAQIFLLYSQGLQPHFVLPSIFILFFFFFTIAYGVLRGNWQLLSSGTLRPKTSAEKLVIPVFYFFSFGSPECITSLPRRTPFKLEKIFLKKSLDNCLFAKRSDQYYKIKYTAGNIWC